MSLHLAKSKGIVVPATGIGPAYFGRIWVIGVMRGIVVTAGY